MHHRCEHCSKFMKLPSLTWPSILLVTECIVYYVNFLAFWFGSVIWEIGQSLPQASFIFPRNVVDYNYRQTNPGSSLPSRRFVPPISPTFVVANIFRLSIRVGEQSGRCLIHSPAKTRDVAYRLQMNVQNPIDVGLRTYMTFCNLICSIQLVSLRHWQQL